MTSACGLLSGTLVVVCPIYCKQGPEDEKLVHEAGVVRDHEVDVVALDVPRTEPMQRALRPREGSTARLRLSYSSSKSARTYVHIHVHLHIRLHIRHIHARTHRNLSPRASSQQLAVQGALAGQGHGVCIAAGNLDDADILRGPGQSRPETVRTLFLRGSFEAQHAVDEWCPRGRSPKQ